MIQNTFSEDLLVEQTAVQLIKELWNNQDAHINAFGSEGEKLLGRQRESDVLLVDRLRTALTRINPEIPDSVLDDAVKELSRERVSQTLDAGNFEIYKIFLDGLNLTGINADGLSEDFHIRFLDFDHPENNDFLCVTQMWIAGDLYRRRPDIIIFVNGIPLIVFELKASHRRVVEAFNENIRDYKDTIPKLFLYNIGVILSNGVESKFGSFSSSYEFYNEWKKIDSESDSASTDLRTIIFGLCDKRRLLDIVENFVLHDVSGGKIKKIVPRYFQYYGVNRAFDQVINRKENNGKLGVFWHTQGSGKSYSMVYLSQKVLRKLEGKFTFIIVTDRKDLDRQSYKNFASVGAVYEKDVHADSVLHLKQLLTEDHRQVFTTIQKFRDIDNVVSHRDDVIVMTDEAHRSQYDTFALNMRKALPNASFIGFTGTPLMSDGEEKTRETFGEYISEYNFGDSVRDGATVPLYYENRIPKLLNVNSNLESDLSEIMDYYDLHDEDEENLELQYSTFYQIITRDDRLNAIALDLVDHFLNRGFLGKAMFVAIDKKTAVRMYYKVREILSQKEKTLTDQLDKSTDAFETTRLRENIEYIKNLDTCAMVSQSQNEIADLEPYGIDMREVRSRILHEDLETRFKNTEDNLRLVFVCAMWMTGFDVPNLSTLYLDKPMKNHTLMQAIARANRVYPEKQNGVIVDYVGVFRNLEKALSIYATTSGVSAIVKPIDELIKELQTQVVKVEKLLLGLDLVISELIVAKPESKLLLLETFANKILENEDVKKDFLNLSSKVSNAYKAILPNVRANEFIEFASAVRALANRIRAIGRPDIDLEAVKRDLEELLDRSISTTEYAFPEYVKVRDLSAMDAEKLKDFFAKLENKNAQAESLKSEIQGRIDELLKKNRKREQFLTRLYKLIDSYNAGNEDVDELIQGLINLARQLDEEESRAASLGLSENELAIFDLLTRENLNPDETLAVKSASKELLERLKERLVPGWRDFDPLRSGVKTTIEAVVYPFLPTAKYSEEDCNILSREVFEYVFEKYPDASQLLAG